MTIRVRRPGGEWDEITGGHVDFHERGGALHVHSTGEPVFYAADDWEAFEVLPDAPVEDPAEPGTPEERVFPEGFV